jgi:hypothetical protein
VSLGCLAERRLGPGRAAAEENAVFGSHGR